MYSGEINSLYATQKSVLFKSTNRNEIRQVFLEVWHLVCFMGAMLKGLVLLLGLLLITVCPTLDYMFLGIPVLVGMSLRPGFRILVGLLSAASSTLRQVIALSLSHTHTSEVEGYMYLKV